MTENDVLLNAMLYAIRSQTEIMNKAVAPITPSKLSPPAVVIKQILEDSIMDNQTRETLAKICSVLTGEKITINIGIPKFITPLLALIKLKGNANQHNYLFDCVYLVHTNNQALTLMHIDNEDYYVHNRLTNVKADFTPVSEEELDHFILNVDYDRLQKMIMTLFGKDRRYSELFQMKTTLVPAEPKEEEEKKNFVGLTITSEYLHKNPDHIFVFGDNSIRKGTGGAAKYRHMRNTYGFITKKYPNNESNSFYIPLHYEKVYEEEMRKFRIYIAQRPDLTFLISKLGAGLANRFGIFEKIIEPRIKKDLEDYSNVRFLF